MKYLLFVFLLGATACATPEPTKAACSGFKGHYVCLEFFFSSSYRILPGSCEGTQLKAEGIDVQGTHRVSWANVQADGCSLSFKVNEAGE